MATEEIIEGGQIEESGPLNERHYTSQITREILRHQDEPMDYDAFVECIETGIGLVMDEAARFHVRLDEDDAHPCVKDIAGLWEADAVAAILDGAGARGVIIYASLPDAKTASRIFGSPIIEMWPRSCENPRWEMEEG